MATLTPTEIYIVIGMMIFLAILYFLALVLPKIVSKRNPPPVYYPPPPIKILAQNEYILKEFNVRKDDRVFISGASGSGKSFFVKHFIHKIKNVIIWDPDDEYDLPAVYKYHALEDYLRQGLRQIRIVPEDHENYYLLNQVCALILKLENICFIIDEAADIVPNLSRQAKDFLTLVRRGRKHDCCVITITQFPSEVHKLPIKNANHYFAFKLHHQLDVKAVERYAPFIRHIQLLPQRRFLYYDVRTATQGEAVIENNILKIEMMENI